MSFVSSMGQTARSEAMPRHGQGLPPATGAATGALDATAFLGELGLLLKGCKLCCTSQPLGQ